MDIETPVVFCKKCVISNQRPSSVVEFNKDSINNTLQVLTKEDKYLNILFDPQTAGGFLFIVANGTKEWAVDREKKYVRL